MIKYILMLMFISFVSCSGNDIGYIGSSTIGLTVMPEAKQVFESKFSIKFGDIQSPGSGAGIKSLMEGKTKLAGISRELNTKELDYKLFSVIIGYDAIVVLVNKRNTVDDIKTEQLRKIFTGKIINWKELGGDDKTINVYLGERGGGTTSTVQKKLLNGEDFSDKSVFLKDSKEVISKVRHDIYGIGITSKTFVNGSSKIVSINGIYPSTSNIRRGKYKLTRPLILLTKGFPYGKESLFISFIMSPEGQRIVAKYFIPATFIEEE